MSSLTLEDRLSLVAREAVSAALAVIDDAYLIAGQSAGPLGDELAGTLDDTIENALHAYEAEGARKVPAFVNASQSPDAVTFHDGAGTAWQFKRLAGGGSYTQWAVATRLYPGNGLFLVADRCWIEVGRVTPEALHAAYRALRPDGLPRGGASLA